MNFLPLRRTDDGEKSCERGRVSENLWVQKVKQEHDSVRRNGEKEPYLDFFKASEA